MTSAIVSPVEKLRKEGTFQDLKSELSIAESFDDVVEVVEEMYGM